MKKLIAIFLLCAYDSIVLSSLDDQFGRLKRTRSSCALFDLDPKKTAEAPFKLENFIKVEDGSDIDGSDVDEIDIDGSDTDGSDMDVPTVERTAAEWDLLRFAQLRKRTDLDAIWLKNEEQKNINQVAVSSQSRNASPSGIAESSKNNSFPQSRSGTAVPVPTPRFQESMKTPIMVSPIMTMPIVCSAVAATQFAIDKKS
ncbi:MAG: hypothetical protein WC747_01450 [Candidatus Babeliales bacterium]|jgi:hypothetical protein